MALMSEHLVLGVTALKDPGSQAGACRGSQHQRSSLWQEPEARCSQTQPPVSTEAVSASVALPGVLTHLRKCQASQSYASSKDIQLAEIQDH